MNKDKLTQEELCLRSKILVDYLRSYLSRIDSFPNFHYYDSRLKKLKSEIDSKYWDI